MFLVPSLLYAASDSLSSYIARQDGGAAACTLASLASFDVPRPFFAQIMARERDPGAGTSNGVCRYGVACSRAGMAPPAQPAIVVSWAGRGGRD